MVIRVNESGTLPRQPNRDLRPPVWVRPAPQVPWRGCLGARLGVRTCQEFIDLSRIQRTVKNSKNCQGVIVAAKCDVCGKGPGFGNSISHSHRRTPRRWNPNVQTVRTTIKGTPTKLTVCTSCIKAGKVSR